MGLTRKLIQCGIACCLMVGWSGAFVPLAYASVGPVLTTDSGSAAFVAGDNTIASPVAIDPGLTVTDSNVSTLTSATVMISGNLQSAEDVLAFQNDGGTMGNITASYDSTSGSLTLTSSGSSATLAQWQQALRAVTYQDSTATPNAATRTISFSAVDSQNAQSNTATRTVTVTDTDQTPIVTTSGGATNYQVATATPVTVDSDLTVSDLDNSTLSSAVVSLSSGFESGDTLQFINTSLTLCGNIMASYNTGSGVLTLMSNGASATLAQWQNALRAVTYVYSGGAPTKTAKTVSFAVSDGTKTSQAATKDITMGPIASSNDNLSGLTISAGTLSPVFSVDTTNYSASVDDSTASINVTPTVADSTATVTVAGYSVTSGSAHSVALNLGSNDISIVVTAQDGSTKTYDLTVARRAIPPVVNGVVQVSTPDELAYIDGNTADYQNSNIELMNDIDMSGLNWYPIVGFNGTFNGNGYNLDQFSAFENAGDDNAVSFFASTGANATIENLTMSHVDIQGEDYETAATLVADNHGIIKNVGIQSGTVSSGEGKNNGGLVANNDGTIDQSFSLVSISGADNTVGDLVGQNNGSIVDSYAAGIASGGNCTLGGLAAGGSGAVTDSYYNSSNASSHGGAPLSLTQMKEQSNFSSWDFAGTWGISPSVNDGFPYLRPQPPTGLTHNHAATDGWIENWTPVLGASSYDVYLNGGPVGTTTDVVYQFVNAQPSTTYHVQVKSQNAADGESALSQADSVTTSAFVYGGGGGPVPPTILTDNFTEVAQVGQKYSAHIVEISGASPLQWTITNGALPPGVSLDSEGNLTGTPTVAGTYTFKVEVTDSNHLSATKQLTIAVNGDATSTSSSGNRQQGTGQTGGTTGSSTGTAVINVTSGTESATSGQPFQMSLKASGGQSPYTWSVVKGVLPKGLELNSQTGLISGTPSAAGIHQITVEVTDTTGMTTDQTVELNILHSYERAVTWGGTVKDVPVILRNDGATKTTYMPIWYVMQLLKPLGITSTWDGKHWRLTTSTKQIASGVAVGSGNSGIYLNGYLVQNVNTVADIDPSTNKPTTYMPIWYVQQILKTMGISNTWDGTTWSVTTGGK